MNWGRYREYASIELVGNEIIGIFLSEQLQCDSNTSWRHPKLRRFVHHEERIEDSRTIGEGIHGVVFLVTIMGDKYKLKVVNMPTTY